MRWKKVALGLALSFASALGCKQQCFMNECDYSHYRNVVGQTLPAHLEHDASVSFQPLMEGTPPPPATVLDPDREVRWISLREALCTALEQGRASGLGVGTVGVPTGGGELNLASFGTTGGRGITGNVQTDDIRVLSLQPAIVGTEMEGALSKFDVRWQSSMTWNTTDRPVGTALETFQASFGRINNISTNDAQFRTGLIKPLPTGGVAGLTFTNDYQLSNLNQRVNPAYRPALQFAFEQPLLQGFGVEINQLRGAHPGSIVTPFNTQSRADGSGGGILITRLRFDQARKEFERNVANLLLSTEVAYWESYGAYWTLFSREQALRQAYEAWKVTNLQYLAGRKSLTDLAQARVQYELFRSQRIDAMGQVLERERALRHILGFPASDCYRIVPSDEPTLTRYNPDWHVAVHETLTLRPELLIARQDLKAQQLQVVELKNQLLPDLRFTTNYDINGIGTRLDGPGPSNAFRSLASNQFHNWSVGLRMDMPIGFRDGHALLRASRLRLAEKYMTVQEHESRAIHFLTQVYRRLQEDYEKIRANRAQREAAAQQLKARFAEFQAGKGTLDILLEAQRFWADALRSEYESIVRYNQALAGFQFAKGTILQHNSVSVAEGPLPECAMIRAVEHERERTTAFVLRERAGGDMKPATYASDEAPLPELSRTSADSLPKVMGQRTELPGISESLPTPRPHTNGPALPELPRLTDEEVVLPPPAPRTGRNAPRTLAPSVRDESKPPATIKLP